MLCWNVPQSKYNTIQYKARVLELTDFDEIFTGSVSHGM